MSKPWEIRDYGTSPVTIAAKGEGPAIAKVYVTEYRKRERSPELLQAARMIAEAPAMLAALRTLVAAFGGDVPDWLRAEIGDAEAIIARIDAA